MLGLFFLRMKFLGTLGDKLITFWVQIRDLYLYIFRHAIIINGYVDDHTWHGIRHRNWGDDLNYFFLRELTGRPVVMYHNFKFAKWFHLKNYLCIGTLLDAVNYSNLQTIVWGSGVSGQERTFVHPKKILSVRGPKTKEFCDRYGVPCPEVFGDPALLLPLVYQPRRGVQCSIAASSVQEVRKASYRLGIIPHVVDLHHPVIEEIREKYADEILIIDLAHYKKWTDVIDQICSCERIFSSSLHGLIVSDAYQVPNCWIKISGKMPGGNFKYFDYASSVHRIFKEPKLVIRFSDILLLQIQDFSLASSEDISNIQNSLIRVCPFNVFLL